MLDRPTIYSRHDDVVRDQMCDMVQSLAAGYSFSDCAVSYGCASSTVLDALHTFIELVLEPERWGSQLRVANILRRPVREVLKYHADLLNECVQHMREEIECHDNLCWITEAVNTSMRMREEFPTNQELHWTNEMDALLGTDTDINIAALLKLKVPQVASRRHSLGIASFGRAKSLAKKSEVHARIEAERRRGHSWSHASSPFAFGMNG